MSGAWGMVELPTGTVTFLFSDIEGSTRLWEEYPEAMKAALARHDAILRDVRQPHVHDPVAGRWPYQPLRSIDQ